MSDPRIDISDVELDASAAKLRAIGDALKPIESRLSRSLADRLEGDAKGLVLGVVLKVRQRADEVGDSAYRQAEELTRRAVFARIADDRGTEADVQMLVAMSAGPNAIDLRKRESYTFLISEVQRRILQASGTGKTVAGGRDGVRSPIDEALIKWEHWLGLQRASGNWIKPEKPPKLEGLWKQVFGTPLPGSDDAATQTEPPLTVTAGETTMGGAVRGPGSMNISEQRAG